MGSSFDSISVDAWNASERCAHTRQRTGRIGEKLIVWRGIRSLGVPGIE
jgi:hypothetical protein